MKKMLFLMLFLLILGAANVNSQVRIGGNGQPHGAAVLDLNADNSATPANKGALALPRVSLASTTANLNGTAPINGMLVYNTNTTLGAGVYYWNGSNWVKVTVNPVGTQDLADGAITNSKIAPGAVDSNSIKNGSISLSDLAPASDTAGTVVLRFAKGAWEPFKLWRFDFRVVDLDYLRTRPVGFDTILEYHPALPSNGAYSNISCVAVPNGNTDFHGTGWGSYYRLRRISSVDPSTPLGLQALCIIW